MNINKKFKWKCEVLIDPIQCAVARKEYDSEQDAVLDLQRVIKEKYDDYYGERFGLNCKLILESVYDFSVKPSTNKPTAKKKTKITA